MFRDGRLCLFGLDQPFLFRAWRSRALQTTSSRGGWTSTGALSKGSLPNQTSSSSNAVSSLPCPRSTPLFIGSSLGFNPDRRPVRQVTVPLVSHVDPSSLTKSHGPSPIQPTRNNVADGTSVTKSAFEGCRWDNHFSINPPQTRLCTSGNQG